MFYAVGLAVGRVHAHRFGRGMRNYRVRFVGVDG